MPQGKTVQELAAMAEDALDLLHERRAAPRDAILRGLAAARRKNATPGSLLRNVRPILVQAARENGLSDQERAKVSDLVLALEASTPAATRVERYDDRDNPRATYTLDVDQQMRLRRLAQRLGRYQDKPRGSTEGNVSLLLRDLADADLDAVSAALAGVLPCQAGGGRDACAPDVAPVATGRMHG